MLTKLFAPPRRLPRDIRDEIHALCHSEQIRRLALPDEIRRDLGMDCGCDRAERHVLQLPR